MPRRLLRNGRIVVDDWSYLAEAEGEPAAALILTVAQWLNDREAWIERGGRLGVVLQPAHKVELLAPDLARFDLIGAEFPGPSEGRGYSQARTLREHWKFGGELRATGYVHRDQLFFSRAAASTASNCRTPRSRKRPAPCRPFRRRTNRPTMRGCRSRCGTAEQGGPVRGCRAADLEILQNAVHLFLRLDFSVSRTSFRGRCGASNSMNSYM